MKNLQLSEENLAIVLKLPRGVQGAGFEAALALQRRGISLKNVNFGGIVFRVLRTQEMPCGFVRLDDEVEDGHSLHETLAAPEIQEIERWRLSILDEATEAALELLADGAAAVAENLGKGGKKVGKRRKQQIVAAQIAAVEAGQCDLFFGRDAA